LLSRQGKRFDDSAEIEASRVPGPGTYKGNYEFIIKRRGVPIIGKDVRKLIIEKPTERQKTPGPGSYRAYTDFGYYENDDHLICKSFANVPS